MGADDRDDRPPMIVTAALTTGIARVTQGLSASLQLFDDILGMDHAEWESILYVGDTEYHCTKRALPESSTPNKRTSGIRRRSIELHRPR